MPVFALDLLPVVDIEGVTSIQGDFLDVATQDKLRKMVHDAAFGSESATSPSMEEGDGFVDVVVSDMMGESVPLIKRNGPAMALDADSSSFAITANTTGNPIVDTEASLELCRAATVRSCSDPS